jgi:hypothetical protein
VAWRLALIDSGLTDSVGTVNSARFVCRCDTVELLEPVPDPIGHGSRMAGIICSANPKLELLIAQVFDKSYRTTAATVAAAVDWSVMAGAHHLHLSLGLDADRPVLRTSIERAIASGCVVVAATPARGAASFPAAYSGVIRATGDARCAPESLAWIAADGPLVAGCAYEPNFGRPGRGASVGAAFVSRHLAAGGLESTPGTAAAVSYLRAQAMYIGRECRGRTTMAR